MSNETNKELHNDPIEPSILECFECGVKVVEDVDAYLCTWCGETFCEDHMYYYSDGCISEFCRECQKELGQGVNYFGTK